MAPSRRSKYLALMPRAAEGDPELESPGLNNTAQEFRQRLITFTNAINNYESTEQVAANIGNEKEGVQSDGIGDTTKKFIEEVVIEVLDENLIQKSIPDEEVAKQANSEEIISKEVTKAYDRFILKMDGSTVGKNVVTAESEDDNDDWVLA
ncbi:hypothetical protein BOTCAL_0158g00120 [Botryotinia calthae]|uniref:Uncharacterized protein n=1 Tax=Botryotinia calthae TaxID=38488 RepID=A0A4Y8D1U2_9HELO|nr:hypothetical protein BOTCAL_0158g00120 [Botryotinia calthae]